MSEKCRNNNSNNSDNALTSRRTDGGKNTKRKKFQKCFKGVFSFYKVCSMYGEFTFTLDSNLACSTLLYMRQCIVVTV